MAFAAPVNADILSWQECAALFHPEQLFPFEATLTTGDGNDRRPLLVNREPKTEAIPSSAELRRPHIHPPPPGARA